MRSTRTPHTGLQTCFAAGASRLLQCESTVDINRQSPGSSANQQNILDVIVHQICRKRGHIANCRDHTLKTRPSNGIGRNKAKQTKNACPAQSTTISTKTQCHYPNASVIMYLGPFIHSLYTNTFLFANKEANLATLQRKNPISPPPFLPP